jgi:hypothetical protein
MPDQRIPDSPLVSDERHDNSVLMMLLACPCPWSLGEIARETQNAVRAEDSVRRLTETGLVHRLDGFVFPTRAARRAAELQVGTG